MKRSLEQEKDAVDLVTDSMISTGFLQDITDFIFSPHRHSMSVGQFYDRWLAERKLSIPKIPFSLGAILGFLYCGLLFTKEHWYDLLPTESFDSVAPRWGLSGTTIIYPAEPAPSFQQVIRRVRNALGHGSVNVNIPSDLTDRAQIMKKVSVAFFDQHPKNPSDTFEGTFTLESLTVLVREFQGVIHAHVSSKS